MHPYNITDASISVFVKDKIFSARKGDPNFQFAAEAIKAGNWAAFDDFFESENPALTGWSRGRFTYDEEREVFFFDKDEVPTVLNGRIVEALNQNGDYLRLLRFWQRLQRNPSKRAIDELWRFMEHHELAIAVDGYVLAYKKTREDYWDLHTGSTFCYLPGTEVSMPRNEVSDDPRVGCGSGIHVGALRYFGGDHVLGDPCSGKVLVLKFDPADVVSVPYEMGSSKIRLCRAFVLGHYGATLPPTVWEDEILDISALPEMSLGTHEEAAEAPPAGEEPLPAEKLQEMTREGLRKYAFRVLGIPGVSSATKDRILSLVEKYRSGELVIQPRRDLGRDESLKWVHDTAEYDLAELPLRTLRLYATRFLHIIGASKIPGGKTALIRAIRRARARPGSERYR